MQPPPKAPSVFTTIMFTRIRSNPTIQRIARDEDGFTLVELLSAIMIGMVILGVGFGAINAVLAMSTRTQSRIDAVNRGRLAVDRIAQPVRAMQCVDQTRPMLWASDTGMEFYASVAPKVNSLTKAQPVERHRIEWVASTQGTQDISNEGKPIGNIVEKVYQSTGVVNGQLQWGAPTTSVLAEAVERAPDRRNPSQLAPFFRYFSYAQAGSAAIDLNSPISANSTFNSAIYNPGGKLSVAPVDLPTIVQVESSFVATPRNTKVAASGDQAFYNTISIRIADPDSNGPAC